MDLELATMDDIVDELRRRRLRFVLVARESSNSGRSDTAWIAGAGLPSRMARHIIDISRRTLDDCEGSES